MGGARDFRLHVAVFLEFSRMPTTQPPLPGMTPRGRPRSGVPRIEQVRIAQAARRKASPRKSLSAEVDGGLLAEFKAAVSERRLTMWEAVEEAIRNWINPIFPAQKR